MTEFTSTCDKPYDRHEYVITFPSGREQHFADYETMQLFWYTHFQISEMTVSVRDRQTKKPRTLGFS